MTLVAGYDDFRSLGDTNSGALVDETLLAVTVLNHPNLSGGDICCHIAIWVEVMEFDMHTRLEL